MGLFSSSKSSSSTSNSIQDNRMAATENAQAIRAGRNVQIIDSKAALAAIEAQNKTARAALAAQTVATQEIRALATDSLDFGTNALDHAFDFASETQSSLFEFLTGKDERTMGLIDDIVDSSQANTQSALDKLIEAERSQDVETFQMIIKMLAGVAIAYFVFRTWGKW